MHSATWISGLLLPVLSLQSAIHSAHSESPRAIERRSTADQGSETLTDTAIDLLIAAAFNNTNGTLLGDPPDPFYMVTPQWNFKFYDYNETSGAIRADIEQYPAAMSEVMKLINGEGSEFGWDREIYGGRRWSYEAAVRSKYIRFTFRAYRRNKTTYDDLRVTAKFVDRFKLRWEQRGSVPQFKFEFWKAGLKGEDKCTGLVTYSRTPTDYPGVPAIGTS